MTIADLLMSQRRWGSTRCRRLLATIPMSETKTVGSMTERQRRALADAASSGRPAGPAVRARELARAGLAPRRRRRAARRDAPRSSAQRVAISTMCPSGSRR